MYMSKALLLFSLIMTTILSAQEVDHTGTYYWESRPDGALFTRKLTILPDGTFTFHWHRDLPSPANPPEYTWGKGTWTSKGKYIYFTTNPVTELDKKHTLNFSNTKGRWDARNNRLILFESDIFWLRKFAITKQ